MWHTCQKTSEKDTVYITYSPDVSIMKLYDAFRETFLPKKMLLTKLYITGSCKKFLIICSIKLDDSVHYASTLDTVS